MEIVSLKDLLTSSGKYPQRETHKEVTAQLILNAKAFLGKLNPFLKELGLTKVSVSSGFRPSDVNAAIPNAAKKSLHMQCLAIDLVDTDGKIDELIEKNDVLLKKYGLWQESPIATKSWTHLDCKDRGKRLKNQFIP